MKNNETDNLLAGWEIDLPDDPQFRSYVWREIAVREAASPINRLREALDYLLYPRFAIPAAATAVVAVMLTATLHGEINREQVWSSLGLAYSSAIDPISYTETLTSTTAPHR